VVAWVTFERKRFALREGRARELPFHAPVTRTFCRDCGTPLTYAHADSPETIDVATCTLDDPTRSRRHHHSWLSHDLSWVRFGDGLPTFQEFSNDKS
jgi:hypothetical protein